MDSFQQRKLFLVVWRTNLLKSVILNICSINIINWPKKIILDHFYVGLNPSLSAKKEEGISFEELTKCIFRSDAWKCLESLFDKPGYLSKADEIGSKTIAAINSGENAKQLFSSVVAMRKKRLYLQNELSEGSANFTSEKFLNLAKNTICSWKSHGTQQSKLWKKAKCRSVERHSKEIVGVYLFSPQHF